MRMVILIAALAALSAIFCAPSHAALTSSTISMREIEEEEKAYVESLRLQLETIMKYMMKETGREATRFRYERRCRDTSYTDKEGRYFRWTHCLTEDGLWETREHNLEYNRWH